MFSRIFGELLQSRGITRYQLYKETGIDQALSSKWLSGKCLPTAEKLITLADYFDCSIDYLLGRTDNPAVNR